jgi:hypothetical protein
VKLTEVCPDADLLGVGAGRDPQRHRGVAKACGRSGASPAARTAGSHTLMRKFEVRSTPPFSAVNTYASAGPTGPRWGGQLLHHYPWQPDGAPPGPGLGWAGVQLAVDLNDDLRDVDRAAQQVDAAAAQVGQLPHSQAAVGAQQHQGSVVGANGVGQAGDLGRVQEAHLLALDLGQPDRPAGRTGDHVGVDGCRKGAPEQLVGLDDSGGREPSGGQLGHPRLVRRVG